MGEIDGVAKGGGWINAIAHFLRADDLNAVRERLNLKKAADPRRHPMWRNGGSALGPSNREREI
jgi:hypothetical protein